jgi:hypothetical protein
MNEKGAEDLFGYIEDETGNRSNEEYMYIHINMVLKRQTVVFIEYRMCTQI